MAITDAAEAIRKYDNYMITSHINAEGDAIGSELAIFYLLRQLGKNAIIVNNDPMPDRFKFLPDWNKFKVVREAGFEGYENIISVDCPTIERSGNIAKFMPKARIKINIDHHVSNDNFGDFNWVNPDASSCGEMIFYLYKEMGLHINEDIARALYLAILTDTGSFRYDSTTSETHRIAGELIKRGVHPPKMAEKVYETKDMKDIELLSKALATITIVNNGRISYMYVTKNMFEETGTTPDKTDGFINYARSIKTSEISIFFKEDMDDTKKILVGFRSKGKVNVNVLAGKFGGGGHPKASGCSLKSSLQDAIKKVLKVAEEFLV